MAAHPFLARLQLDAGADARAIRRAYARELKLIDQETEPDAFQQLRECYERALAWAEAVARAAAAPGADGTAVNPRPQAVAHHAPETARAPERAPESASASASARTPAQAQTTAGQAASDPHPARDVFQGPDAPTQARAVFDDLCLAIPALLASPGEPGLDPWLAALRQALADPRLEHLEARAHFEQRMAGLLAAGWRSGHEWLLPAAAKVFGWDADRRALARLRMDGMALNTALDQQAAFEAQSAPVRARQRQVLALLRQPSPPPEQTMWNLILPLRTMAAHFPQWLGLVAPAGAVKHWMERCAEADRPSAAAAPAGTPKLNMRSSAPNWIGLGFMLLMLVSFLSNLGNGNRTASQPRRPLDPDIVRIMRDAQRHATRAPEQPLSEQQLAAIRARIDYRPSPATPAGVQECRVEIYLDDDGNMIGVKRLKLSADPAFGAAVEKAVHDSGPFPASTARVFEVGFKMKISYRRVPVFKRNPAPWEVRRPAAAPSTHARPWPPYPEAPGPGLAVPAPAPDQPPPQPGGLT